MTSKWYGLAPLLAATALALVSPAAAQTPPNVLVVVQIAEPASLDPHVSTAANDFRIAVNLYDGLVRNKSGTLEIEPALATDWTISDDGLEYTFNLREGVSFHDGTPFNADAVKFNFDRMLDETHPYADTGPFPLSFFFSAVETVEVIDDLTVKFTLNEAFAPFMSNLASATGLIVSPAAVEQYGADYGRNPVGTGPYKIADWVDGEYIKLVAHDDYFGGKPTAKSVTFVEVPEVSARIAGLVSGEYDIAVNIPPDQIPVIEGYDDLKVEQIVLDNTHMLVFFNTGPLQDKRVRQALSLAIDRALLREALWNDKNYTPNGHQLPSYTMWIKDFPEFEYNPEKARELLKEAGYNGEEIVYKLPLNYYLLSMEAAQAMQQMWGAVGLNVKLEPVENWSQVTDANSTVHIRPWSNTHRMPDPLGSFVPQWGRDSDVQRNKQDAARSWQAPARFNELQDVIVTSTDWDERQKAYREALEIWNDEAPGTMLYNPLETYAMRKDVNWQPYGLYYMDLRPYNLQFGLSN